MVEKLFTQNTHSQLNKVCPKVGKIEIWDLNSQKFDDS